MTAVLAGLVPSTIPATTATAFPLDACGIFANDYNAVFTGSVYLNGGPEQLNYSITLGGGFAYSVVLTVAGASGQYQTQGFAKILGVYTVGVLELKIPHWHPNGRITYETVTTDNTQCQQPNVVNDFTITVPDGPQIVMINTGGLP
ncbi:hypothetical protein ABZY81_41780 [Streptomyces sp. NPDC006514]|uniref:hypothetical protein n=1 Tax=Streptomyces sp. NPDC006514 TaxID=3154308 RepID=UPI0033AB855F